MAVNTKVHKKFARKIWLWILIAVVIVALAVSGAVLALKYMDSRDEVKRLSNPQEAAKEEVKTLREKVGLLVELPNEDPTLATVKDITKLQDQAFFKNAQNGDKVLIFTQAKKAVLYRPSTNKVIEVAPVNLGDKDQ